MIPLAVVFFHVLRVSVQIARPTARKPSTHPMPTVTRSFKKLCTLILHAIPERCSDTCLIPQSQWACHLQLVSRVSLNKRTKIFNTLVHSPTDSAWVSSLFPVGVRPVVQNSKIQALGMIVLRLASSAIPKLLKWSNKAI